MRLLSSANERCARSKLWSCLHVEQRFLTDSWQAILHGSRQCFLAAWLTALHCQAEGQAFRLLWRGCLAAGATTSTNLFLLRDGLAATAMLDIFFGVLQLPDLR